MIESGPFALVRHPMYSGGILLGLGWALFACSWLTVGYVVVLFVFLDLKARREEAWLVEWPHGKTWAQCETERAKIKAWRVATDRLVYASVSRGFKAGGFNAASPAGSEAYGEEHGWSLEGGLKTLWAKGRVSANASVFRIDWDQMQLNVPNPYAPAQCDIANVGGARSSGAEFELHAMPGRGLDLVAAMGVTRAHFRSGSLSAGVDVSGNELPNTPAYTVSFGAQYSRTLGASPPKDG